MYPDCLVEKLSALDLLLAWTWALLASQSNIFKQHLRGMWLLANYRLPTASANTGDLCCAVLLCLEHCFIAT